MKQHTGSIPDAISAWTLDSGGLNWMTTQSQSDLAFRLQRHAPHDGFQQKQSKESGALFETLRHYSSAAQRALVQNQNH